MPSTKKKQLQKLCPRRKQHYISNLQGDASTRLVRDSNHKILTHFPKRRQKAFRFMIESTPSTRITYHRSAVLALGCTAPTKAEMRVYLSCSGISLHNTKAQGHTMLLTRDVTFQLHFCVGTWKVGGAIFAVAGRRVVGTLINK